MGTILPAPRVFMLCVLSHFLLIANSVSAEGLSVTGYLGYRVGGEFEDAITGTTLKLAESESYGLIVGQDNGSSTQYEFLFSRQPTSLTAGGLFTPGVLVDIDVENYLIAVKRILDRDAGTFVSGMVGATRFDPSSSSLSPETRFSLGIGGGLDYRISKNLGFRLEGRGIATLLDSSGMMFCSSSDGCSVFVGGSMLWQFEFITGFTFKF